MVALWYRMFCISGHVRNVISDHTPTCLTPPHPPPSQLRCGSQTEADVTRKDNMSSLQRWKQKSATHLLQHELSRPKQKALSANYYYYYHYYYYHYYYHYHYQGAALGRRLMWDAGPIPRTPVEAFGAKRSRARAHKSEDPSVGKATVLRTMPQSK